MGLVSPAPLLQDARKNGYAIAACNFHSFDMLQAIVEAAEEMNAPIILQTTTGTIHHLGLEYIVAAVRVAAGKTGIPVALHLDHCRDFAMILRCLRAGYTSVMIDASMHAFEENVRQTKKVVEIAQALDVNVEAELGVIKGAEDDHAVSGAGHLADPRECAQFVEETGVTTLAPAIGNEHGMNNGTPAIDFDRLTEIARVVHVPLVLHGGSGISGHQLERCISSGISKINFATELKYAYSNAIMHSLQNNPQELDPRQYMQPAKAAVKRVVMEKIRLCGSEGKAGA